MQKLHFVGVGGNTTKAQQDALVKQLEGLGLPDNERFIIIPLLLWMNTLEIPDNPIAEAKKKPPAKRTATKAKG